MTDPQHVAALNRALEALDWPAASTHLQALLSRHAQDPGLWVQKSYVDSYRGHYALAREAIERAASLAPTSEEMAADVLARLRTFNQVQGMRTYLRRLGPVTRLPIPLLLSAASHFSSVNDQDTALTLLEEATRADPQFPPTLLAHAQVLMYLGRMKDADAALSSAIQRAPQIAQAWWLASRIRRQDASRNDVEAMQRELARPGRRPNDIVMLGNALHKVLDDLGRHGEAWQALEIANRNKRGTLDHSTDASNRLLQSLHAVSMPHAPMAAAAHDATPIFIIGMHRSGTTLLEQMLDGHSQVHGAGELYDFTSAMRHATDHHCQGVIDATIIERASQSGFDFAEVGQRYLEGVQWRLGEKRFFTDKLPSNFLNVGFICRALPQAKLLHMVRDPREVCFSNLRELFSSANAYSYDQLELADFHLQYHALMAHWREAFPGRILDIHYDRLVREPEAVIREVCEFCGLDFEPEMLAIGNRTRGVSTASAVQVRGGIQARDVPKWKPYEAQLQPMITRLRAGGVLPD